MKIIKEHLLANDYVWNNNTSINKVSEGPTRRRFDRFNGNCVLHIINLFDCFVAKLGVDQAHAIERLLERELPLEAKSEVSVLRWLKDKHAQIFQPEAV